MNKIKIPISGMHCKSCEILVEQELSEISNIKKVEVNHKTGTAEIFYEGEKPRDKEIEEAVCKVGYCIGEQKKKTFLSKNLEDYKDVAIAAIFLIGIFLIAKNLGLTNMDFTSLVASPSSLSVVFLVGLTAGLSTCMALVGGLILGVSARHSEKHPEASAVQKFRPHLFFNFGRILSFAFLGGLLGLVGKSFNISGTMQGILIMLVGVVMLIMGLKLIGIFPKLENVNFVLPKRIGKILGIKNGSKEYSHGNSMVLGALTFFLPCGFTQTMQVLAVSSGSFLGGALIMGIFAFGTLPGLLGVGALTSFVRGVFAERFFKFAGILVLVMAVFNISNGYNLTGWQFLGSKNSSNGTCTSQDVCTAPASDSSAAGNQQIINMTENAGGYSPNSFNVKKGIPVKWVIDAQEPYSCASSIVVPKLGIRKNLTKGQNAIEFTPTEAGTLTFSCSMGMYTGRIVVE